MPVANGKAPVAEARPGKMALPSQIEDFAAPAPRRAPAKPVEEVPESEIDAADDPDLQAVIESAEEAAAAETATEESEEAADAVESEDSPADDTEQPPEQVSPEAKGKKEDKAVEKSEPEVIEWPEDDDPAPAAKPAEAKKEIAPEAAKELEETKAKLAQVEGEAQFGRTIDNLILEFPELELAMLTAFEAKGMLKDEWKPKLETLRKEIAPQAAASAIPKDSVYMDGYGVVTNAACKAHYDKLLKDSAFDAQVFFTKWQKAQQDVIERPQREAAKRAEIAKKEVERRQAVEASAVKHIQTGLAELAPKLPQYLKTEADGVTRFTDKAVFDAFQKAAKGVSPQEPVAEIVRYALFKLRRLKFTPAKPGAAKVAAQAKNGARPPVRSTATSKTAPRQQGKGPAGKVGFTAEIEDMGGR